MVFPAKPETPVETPTGLVEALGAGVRVKNASRNQFDFLVEVESESMVREMQPDFRQLSKIPGRGVIVTSRADSSDYDFVSRFFAPAVGVNEDPATGSAHQYLHPYLHERSRNKQSEDYQ